jgi:hypothetical protein
VVPYRDDISVFHFEIGLVPFQHKPPTSVLDKHDLRAEQPNLEIGEMVPVTLQDRDSPSIIQDLISETALLMSNKLSSNSVHGERRREID